ncbi:putative MFS family arabinose efflux permease [Kribbella sp. VKM Ac-2527]|uniref:Putative proline/betaine transporter n=1 Tax=Kribbella caucasensis TaxID=2512215 RepID=A0A4R6KPM2_9ACTN|nr:MFS transporter [Kribbella sp. VKM Ac-2527]TDO54592.1 putative MFS family arabinose efflux permease [Kribbella sp. VKM Ac-2527]
MSSTSGTATLDVRRHRRSLVAGTVGNFVEWYEFGAYGFFATVIAANFFSSTSTSDAESLIKTYASFALAFFFRPIGAAVFGRVGDRIGRRPTLILVLLLMTFSTTLIGLLPTYATVGAAAPWLLTLVRAMQGLSAGGEFGGAVAIMTEFAPRNKRGLYGAWQSLTVAFGLLVGAGLAAILATVLSTEALKDWGWRVPFLLALPLGLVALWLRLRLDETPNFSRIQEQERQPADKVEVAKAIALGIGRLMGWSAAGYTFLVVMPSYLQATLNATFQQALVATVLANFGFAVSIMPAGWISDRIGRRPVMVTGAALVVVLAFPLMNLLQDKESSNAAKGFAVFVAGLVVGLMAGPGPAMLAEMFPTRARYTGLGLAYSLSNAVFSGCAGLIITELIKRTKNIDIPAWYVVVTCAVSVIALLTLRGDDHRRELRD